MAINLENIGGLIERLIGQATGDGYEQGLNQYYAARENEIRARAGESAKKLASRAATRRGFNPNDGFALRMENEFLNSTLTPQLDALTTSRAQANAQRQASLVGLIPTLLNLYQFSEQQKDRNLARSQAAGGGFSAPPGVPIGTITNPEVLTGGWKHTPSSPWFGTGGQQVRFSADGPGPNTLMNQYMAQGLGY